MIRWTKRRPGAGPQAIATAQRYVGEAHRDWIDFLREHDGATPGANVFDVEADNQDEITRFWDVAEVGRKRAANADWLPPTLVAIAETDGGNDLCLDLGERRGVCLWDHELEEATRVADSFTAFLEQLRPFDPSTVKPEPGQVIRRWVDPDFLAQVEQERDEDD